MKKSGGEQSGYTVDMKHEKKIKFLFISLRDPYLDNDRVMPPIGVMALHSYILGLGFESHIENNFKLDDIDSSEQYTHIGISCMTPQRDQAYDALHAIKRKYPEKIVIIGGSHPKYYLSDCIKEPFDYIVVGDGELTLNKIIAGGQEAKERVVDIQMSEDEMNRMPLPYREPGFLNQYNFFMQGVRSTTILTAKGCPMNCAFCEDAKTKVRLYKPAYVGAQIDQAKKAGYKGIMFFDDIFALSLKRVEELANEIDKHDIYYRCFGHSRNMTEQMARVLSSTGCIETGFGAESGSQRILDAVGKKTTVEHNKKYIDLCNKHGIRVKAFLMIGLPGENMQTVKETENFVEYLLSKHFVNRFGKKITNDFDLGIYFPYKGTRIRDSIDMDKREYDLFFANDPDSYRGVYKGKHGTAEAMMRTSSISCDEIVNIQKELFSKYKKYVVN